MDLTLSAAEQAIIELTAAATPARSKAGEFDREHWAAFEAAGLGSAAAGEAGLLGAAMAVEEGARRGSLTPLGASALVLPLFGQAGLAALTDVHDPDGGLVRYGADAELVVRIEGDHARLHRADPGQAKRATSHHVYPVGSPAAPTGVALASAPAERVRARQRLGIAAEAVGAMDSTLQQICAYVRGRRQFGQPLGSLQAVQHRLAELAIDLEMARWLARQAAWDDTGASAAVAAAFAARRARRFAWDIHQLAGARGFTLEMGLSFDTLRLQALSVEAGGAKAHDADAVALTWPATRAA